MAGDRFCRVPPEAAADPRLSKRALRVLIALCLHVDEDGYCWPKQTVLAEKTGLSRQKVNEAIRELADADWIKVLNERSQKSGRYSSNYYLITPPPERVRKNAAVRNRVTPVGDTVKGGAGRHRVTPVGDMDRVTPVGDSPCHPRGLHGHIEQPIEQPILEQPRRAGARAQQNDGGKVVPFPDTEPTGQQRDGGRNGAEDSEGRSWNSIFLDLSRDDQVGLVRDAMDWDFHNGRATTQRGLAKLISADERQLSRWLRPAECKRATLSPLSMSALAEYVGADRKKGPENDQVPRPG